MEEEPGAEERADTFPLWPGLDHQLELAFHSLDLDETGLLPYSTLEPVLRHQLMQIGLIEYVTRFALPDGRLDDSYVRSYLNEYQVDLTRELDIIDWKNMMLAWIRCVQDAQYEDIDKWQKSVTSMQEAQSREYQTAMRQFQQHYINQLEQYYRAVDEVHKKEEEYRAEWESSLGMQEEFYNSQLEFIKNQEQAALAHYNRQVKGESDIQEQYIKELKGKTTVGPGNITTTTYTYPVTVTATGAPVSAGAQVPSRRVLVKPRRRGGCC